MTKSSTSRSVTGKARCAWTERGTADPSEVPVTSSSWATPRLRKGPPRLCDNDGRAARLSARHGGASRGRRGDQTMRGTTIGWVTGAALLVLGTLAWTDGPTPTVAPPPGPPSAERHFQQGLEAQKQGNWRRAAQEYQEAINQREAFPEAWNGLGYSLRQQGKYAEAIKAYDRALKLRPDYAEALEYLGEAYVKMGKLDEARAVLSRLESLDKKEAAELRAAIDKAKQ